MHFLISQIVGNVAILLILQKYGLSVEEAIDKYTILMTGITALVTMFPAVYFYRRDKARRIAGGVITSVSGKTLSLKESALLLVTGAGLAQYGNLIAGFIQMFFDSSYQENMDKITDGKSFLMLVFWIGIIAPIAEELIFRWLIYLRLRDYLRVTGAAVISGVIFGIYHGNLVQAVYAGLLGAAFAYILEVSGNLWSCVLLHIGANVWSLILSEYGEYILGTDYGIELLLITYAVTLAGMTAGMSYFSKKGKKRKYRVI